MLVCKDGYRPSISFSCVYVGEAYLAFNDLSQQENWADENKFAPYYLVWGDEKHTAKGSGWPYGLVAIELVQNKDLFVHAYPHHDPKMQAGFELFKKYCMKCHSINKTGGDMGPELNYPKNITEYWSQQDILASTAAGGLSVPPGAQSRATSGQIWARIRPHRAISGPARRDLPACRIS